MKRLASCLSQLLTLIIVSTLVPQKGFNTNTCLNLFRTSSSQVINTRPITLFALAQEYSTIEERVYISESFIDQDGKEKGREYARLGSYKVSPPAMLASNPQQQSSPPLQYVAQGPNEQSYQQVHQQQHDHMHPDQLTIHSPSVADPLAHHHQQQQQLSSHMGHGAHDQNKNFVQEHQQASVAGHSNTHHHNQHQHLSHDNSKEYLGNKIISHHEAALSATQDQQHIQQMYQQQQDNHNHHHHQHNQQQENHNHHIQQQQGQQDQQQQVLTDGMQQVLAGSHSGNNLAQNNLHIHYAHTQIEWRRESTDDGDMNEFYLHNYQELASAPRNQHQPVVDHLTYIQYQQQKQHQQPQQHFSYNQHQNDPHAQSGNDQQPSNHHQLVDNLHHQQFIYARHISDEHDFEAAHQYYYSGRPSMVPPTSPSCDPIDDSTILILPDQFQQPTCRAASTLGSGEDPAAAAAQATTDSFNAHSPSRNSNVESFPLAPQHFHYESSLMAAIRHYWREVSGLCIASAIFLNWLFVVVKRKIIGSSRSSADRASLANEVLLQNAQQIPSATATTTTTKSQSKDTNSAHDSAFEENISPMSLDDADTSSHTESSSSPRDKSTASLQNLQRQRSTSPVLRQRSSTLKADNVCCPSSGHASLSQSTSLSTTVSNTSEYISRYSSDFDSIQRLGRGGFGIVFEAKNKIDDCHYAVKRICLPLEKEARERVMREVRALAKLDHAGIVRYYNAWLETPPDDWLKQHDAQLGIHSRDGTSFPSTDGIYDRGESDLQQTRCTRAPVDEGGDNSSDWFIGGRNKNSRYIRTNGYNTTKFLSKNSSSPSLDIVFEGSGSIRLESENSTKQTDSNNSKQLKSRNKQQNNKKNGDTNNSDSEDSDFIQFGSKGNDGQSNATNDFEDDASSDDETSFSANHLTEPFSSSSSNSNHDENNPAGIDIVSKRRGREKENALATTPVGESRKKALSYQREMRQMQNGENNINSGLHFEKVYLYIQMQLCRKDTLRDWLRTNCDNRDKTTIFDLFYQIVDAVEYVHSQDLIHRDLKPSNIFFSLDGTLKIGDFGLCRAKTNAGVGSSLDLQEYVAESEVERGFDAVHTEQVGTQLYMSPEQLNGLSYNQKVDIFAMGLILLELLVPFKTQMQRVNVLFKARNNLYSEEFKRDYCQEYELVKSLLSRSPLKRPTATEIKQNDLLANAQLSQPVIERIYHRRRTISSNSSTE